MKNKYKIFIGLAIVFTFVLAGCAAEDGKEADKPAVEEPKTSSSIGFDLSKSLEDVGLETTQMIKDKDMEQLSSYVHPSKGLTFTPNVFITPESDLVFTAAEVAGLPVDETLYKWGYYINSDFDIELNFNDYYDLYIYDKDYINAEKIGNNTVINTGDEIDNVVEVYPNAEFLEYMFIGTLKEVGSDWRSLKLVFEESEGKRYLISIIHGQWIYVESK
jgi:hypothetical protein